MERYSTLPNHPFSSAAGEMSSRGPRGVDAEPNWSSGEGETQGAFDRALAQLVDAIGADIVTRCRNG
jgi:hypothetical protein